MASQSQFGKWSVQRRINTGGQADFYSVIDSTQFLDDSQLKTLAMQAFDELNKNRDVGIRHLQTVIKDVIARESANLKALKHIRSKSNKAQSRFAEEIRLLTEIQHAALIPLVDSNVEQRWFVTDHYPATLSDALAAYKNRGLATLQAIQPIVEAVGRLHSKGVIHRDIKPDNIYRTAKGNLVLGDFGIAIDVSEEEARLTESLERVGSRDWMPVWATLGRLEDATPAFDVYTIGKVIWGMVLGENRLPFKYGYDGRFDLNTSVCSAEEVPWLQRIVRETVVESPAEAVQNAGELLPMINIAIEALTSGYQDVKVPDRRCRVCGRGRYEKLVDLDAGRQANFGLNVISQPRFKIFICSYCAHVQQFYFRDGLTPQAWA